MHAGRRGASPVVVISVALPGDRKSASQCPHARMPRRMHTTRTSILGARAVVLSAEAEGQKIEVRVKGDAW